VSEEEEHAMIGKLAKQKQEATVQFNKIDSKLKDIGTRIEKLGGILKNTVAGGDYRDLLNFLESAGVTVPEISSLLTKRNDLAKEIQECTSGLEKLGISQQ
jgi:hypothetical protein